MAPAPGEAHSGASLELTNRLANWAREESVRQAVATRTDADLQNQIALESAGFDGLIVDAFEQRLELTVHIANGRNRAGRITKASSTLIEFTANPNRVFWVSRRAITAITTTASGTPTNRELSSEPTMLNELALVSESRPRVRIWIAGVETAFCGHINWVGSDVVALGTTGPNGNAITTYVAVESIIELSFD